MYIALSPVTYFLNTFLPRTFICCSPRPSHKYCFILDVNKDAF